MKKDFVTITVKRKIVKEATVIIRELIDGKIIYKITKHKIKS